MKKFIFAVITALIMGTAIAHAQTNAYRTTEFAMGIRNAYGTIVWGDWEPSNIKLTIDWTNDVITIFSNEHQRYVVYSVGQETKDSNGSSVDCIAVDKDGGKCKIRLRIQNDGTSQVYVFYSDVAWVYNIIRI